MKPKDAASGSFGWFNREQKERCAMTVTSPTTSSEQTLYAALELSKNSWLLAIQMPDRDKPSLHPIKGGDAEGLIAKLDAARQRLAKASGQVPKVTLCYSSRQDHTRAQTRRTPSFLCPNLIIVRDSPMSSPITGPESDGRAARDVD
jgi:hypothetical protein